MVDDGQEAVKNTSITTHERPRCSPFALVFALALRSPLSFPRSPRQSHFDNSQRMAGSRRKGKSAAISYQKVDSDIDMQDDDRQVEASKGEFKARSLDYRGRTRDSCRVRSSSVSFALPCSYSRTRAAAG